MMKFNFFFMLASGYYILVGAEEVDLALTHCINCISVITRSNDNVWRQSLWGGKGNTFAH